MAKAWVLWESGEEDSSNWGIVTDESLVREWQSRGSSNYAEEFELNVLPAIDRNRDDKMFPYAPNTAPLSPASQAMVDAYTRYATTRRKNAAKLLDIVK